MSNFHRCVKVRASCLRTHSHARFREPRQLLQCASREEGRRRGKCRENELCFSFGCIKWPTEPERTWPVTPVHRIRSKRAGERSQTSEQQVVNSPVTRWEERSGPQREETGRRRQAGQQSKAPQGAAGLGSSSRGRGEASQASKWTFMLSHSQPIRVVLGCLYPFLRLTFLILTRSLRLRLGKYSWEGHKRLRLI